MDNLELALKSVWLFPVALILTVGIGLWIITGKKKAKEKDIQETEE